MLHPLYRERLAAALDAVTDLPRADAELVDRTGTRFCFLGGLVLIAGQQGAPITLDRTAECATFVVNDQRPERLGLPGIVPGIGCIADVIDDPFPATIAASEWFGVDLAALRIDPAAMPEDTRDAIDERLTAASVAYPVRFKLMTVTGCSDGAWTVWALSDLGLSFRVLADAVRVAVGVDCVRVPGTLEHALKASQDAMTGVGA